MSFASFGRHLSLFVSQCEHRLLPRRLNCLAHDGKKRQRCAAGGGDDPSFQFGAIDKARQPAPHQPPGDGCPIVDIDCSALAASPFDKLRVRI
jgi:hypothetical protein